LTADLYAYFFATNADAWRRFCAEQDFDAAWLAASNPNGWMLNHCEEHMPGAAPSREELIAHLRGEGSQLSQLATADDLLVSWRRLFQACAGRALRLAEGDEGQ
jgi:hypothetical protein